MKKKVIFFSPSRCAGAERVSATISKFLSNEKFEVVYHLFGPENQMEEFLPADRVSVWHKQANNVTNLISAVRRIVKQEKPDIIYSSQMPYNWRIALATLGLPCKIIFRSNNYIYTQSFFQKLRLAFAYRRADKIIAQTEEMREGIVKKLFINEKKVITLANPIDEDYINQKLLNVKSPYHEGCLNFVGIGRFHKNKGFDILIEAFAKVIKKKPNAVLYLVGRNNDNPPYYNLLMNLIEKYQLQDKIKIEGFQNNPYKYMKYADCFVLSSRIEGLPNVLVEALYTGTPVAATTCVPVVSRIVDNGVNGFLARKEDPDSLAEAMIKASGLGRIQSTYAQSSRQSFMDLFMD